MNNILRTFVFIFTKCRISSIDRSSSFSPRKISMKLRSVRNWIVSTRTILRPIVPSPSGLLNLKSHNMTSEIYLEWTVRPSTITTDENIQVIQQIVMCDRQACVRRVAYKWAIPTTTVYEIISNDLDMNKISTRWILKLLTPIQHANRVDYCQEFL